MDPSVRLELRFPPGPAAPPQGEVLDVSRRATGSVPVKSEGKRCFLPSGMGLQAVPLVVLAAMDWGVFPHSIRAEDLNTPNFTRSPNPGFLAGW